MFFRESSICSSNRPYYLIEQILIFQEALSSPRTRTHTIFEETLSSSQTHTIFQETLCLEQIRIFHRYFIDRSRWMISKIS